MRGNEANRVISVSQGGLYHCRGGRGDPVYYTEDSSDVTVVETFPSKPTVTLQPSWTQIYSGETVTVRCEIQGGEGAQWTYEWRAAKLNTPPTSNEYRITVTESDSGGYSCRGRRDYFFSEWSDIITLTVSYKPKAKLRADNTAVPVGGSVTLTCSVNSSSSSSSSSSGWKYYWYRDDTPVDAVSPSNGQISVSQEGLYRCRGGRGNPVYYTEDSQEVHINTTGGSSLRVTVRAPPQIMESTRMKLMNTTLFILVMLTSMNPSHKRKTLELVQMNLEISHTLLLHFKTLERRGSIINQSRVLFTLR
uniref:Ig-like domain-containing protein n=1 Tax=Oreochromis aureus TaxID=47969 RepID=A0AAZ1Y211_OREAU